VTKRPTSFVLLGILGLSLALVACVATRQTRSVETSGFLGDYSELREGERGEAQLIYINPDANFPEYDASMIDPVTLWQNSQTSKVSQEDQQMLTGLFYQALHGELSEQLQASAPRPPLLLVRSRPGASATEPRARVAPGL
jgi:hypothetical protein